MPNLMKIRAVGTAERTNRQTTQTGMTQLIVAFSNFA